MPRPGKYFFEIHSGLPREGPGSDQSSLKALKSLPSLSAGTRVADMGCGPGRSTLLLAKHSEVFITALDIHQPFLDRLTADAKALNVGHRIRTVRGDMGRPPFRSKEFDLIWSEGAIYLIGLERGLRTWRRFLKEDGFVAVTHLSWLTSHPSPQTVEFWAHAFPEIRSIREDLAALEGAGFGVIDYFSLPPSDWWDEYYAPMERRIRDVRRKYQGVEDAEAACAQSQKEIDLWKTHGADYGYVFYIARKKVTSR